MQTERICRLAVIGSEFLKSCTREISWARGGSIVTSEALGGNIMRRMREVAVFGRPGTLTKG